VGGHVAEASHYSTRHGAGQSTKKGEPRENLSFDRRGLRLRNLACDDLVRGKQIDVEGNS